MTQDRNIVADGWERVSKPHPHTNPIHILTPFQTYKHTQKIDITRVFFSLYDSVINDRRMDQLTDRQTNPLIDLRISKVLKFGDQKKTI